MHRNAVFFENPLCRSPLLFLPGRKLRHHHQSDCTECRVLVLGQELPFDRMYAGSVENRRRRISLELDGLNEIQLAVPKGKRRLNRLRQRGRMNADIALQQTFNVSMPENIRKLVRDRRRARRHLTRTRYKPPE